MAYLEMLLNSIFLAFQSLCVSGYFSKHRCQIQQMAFKPERVCALRSVTSAEKYSILSCCMENIGLQICRPHLTISICIIQIKHSSDSKSSKCLYCIILQSI